MGRPTSDTLTFADYQAAHAERLITVPWDCDSWSLLEWAGALCGEAGEFANLCKKLKRDKWESEVDQDELAHELADVVAYAFVIAGVMGIDMAKYSREKFNIVSKRHGVKVFL